MHFWYLPTVDYPLWPCVGLVLLVLIPVTIWHERAWRRTLAEYGRARSAAGAADPWPPEGMGALLGVQPWLLLTAATLLAVMTGLGLAALLMWPRKVPFFDAPLNYFDRPYVAATVVAGMAAVVGAIAVAVDLDALAVGGRRPRPQTLHSRSPRQTRQADEQRAPSRSGR